MHHKVHLGMAKGEGNMYVSSVMGIGKEQIPYSLGFLAVHYANSRPGLVGWWVVTPNNVSKSQR